MKRLSSSIRNTWMGYVLAVGLVAGMTLLKLLLEDLFGLDLRLMLLPASVMLSVWFGGVRAGLLAIVLSTISRTFFFIEPSWSLQIGSGHIVEIFFHVLEVSVFFALTYAVYRSRSKHQQLERKATNILESIRDVFLSVDHTWRVTYANKNAERIAQRPLDELIGKTLWELYPDLQGTPVEAHYRKAMEERVPVQFETQGVLTSAWYETSVYPSEEGISIYARDVSERKEYEESREQARQEAEELAAAKTALLANMSHEVRTPLTGLLLMAEMLSKRFTGEHRDHILRMKKGAERLADLLNAVLTLSRLEAGRVEISTEVIDLVEEVEQTVASLRPLAIQKDLSLTIEEHGPCYALADSSSLHSVLNNLIGNAIKFTEIGGVNLIIESGVDERVGGPAAIIRVQDTGPGIAPHFLPHLFEEFRQEATGILRKHEGVGLGLAISKRLAELMNGVIDVESQHGFGTTFTVTLPGADASARAEQVMDEQPASDSGRMPHVLIMDDDELMLELIPELLKGICIVEKASTPRDALNWAASKRFDAILLDISMGTDISGEVVLQKLRQHPDYRITPIIAVTAYALPGDEARFLKLGFDGYVSKPFDGAGLTKVLRHTLLAAAR